MGIAIGFGEQEISNEEKIASDIFNKFKQIYGKSDKYFDSEMVSKFRWWFKKYEADLFNLGEKYRNMSVYEAPQRYCYFWAEIINTTNGIYIDLDIHHINRRHPFSPDGWGMWKRNIIICIKRDWDNELQCMTFNATTEIE